MYDPGPIIDPPKGPCINMFKYRLPVLSCSLVLDNLPLGQHCEPLNVKKSNVTKKHGLHK